MSKAGDQEYNQALDAVEAGKLSQAIHAVEAALMSDAKDSGYWQLYSVLLSQVGRIEDAEKAKNKAVEFGVGEVETLLMKAAEAAASKNWDKAITACEQALELEPERGEVWASYAANLMEGGYREDALEASSKAVEMIPGEPQLWYLRGRILRLTGKLADAGLAFQKAVELEPKYALAWYEKGMVHHQQEELPCAKEAFLKAKELELNDPGVDKALQIMTEAGA